MDDLTEQFIRSLGRMHAERAADDLTACFARNVGAVFAEQEREQAARGKAERSRARSARIEANLAEMARLRAESERKYGPMDEVAPRMMSVGAVARARIMGRASYRDYPPAQ